MSRVLTSWHQDRVGLSDPGRDGRPAGTNSGTGPSSPFSPSKPQLSERMWGGSYLRENLGSSVVAGVGFHDRNRGEGARVDCLSGSATEECQAVGCGTALNKTQQVELRRPGKAGLVSR